jgi:teichuronic acid biosynthesis glycosyltransferase TuaC
LPRTFPYEVTAESHAPSDMPNARYIEYPALPVISRPFNGLSIAQKIKRQVAALRPDLILSYIIYPDGFAAVKIGRELGIPVLVKAIGSDLNRIPDPITRQLIRWTLKNATYVLTVSGDLREKAISLGSKPRRTIAARNGCDTTIFYPADRRIARTELGLPIDCRLALFVGRLDIPKGVYELLSAVASIDSLRVAFIGDGLEAGGLRLKARQYGIDERVTFVPSAPREKVAQWLAACDVFTLPSYAEGCPNAVMEALCSGRPVVATAVGGISELVDGDCGFLVPARDPLQLATSLREALRITWDANRIARAHQRSWEDVTRELADLLVVARRSDRTLVAEPELSMDSR